MNQMDSNKGMEYFMISLSYGFVLRVLWLV